MAFAENLKKLREAKGWTQAELANMVGVGQPAIAQYEMGIKVPNIVVGLLLAKKLDTTCEELVS
ncbi:MAG: helix-turn-helix domain-containing protein [Clostridium sp.]|nr:helix-turn-helix domain-containing protein [Clostridium sp.]